MLGRITAPHAAHRVDGAVPQPVYNADDTTACQYHSTAVRDGLPMDDDWGTVPRIAVGKVRLRDVLKSRKTIIDYIYDFGDGWEHRLTVTDGPRRPAGRLIYPRYIGGERNGPPEEKTPTVATSPRSHERGVVVAATTRTYLLRHEDQACSGWVHHPGAAGCGCKTAVRPRLGSRKQA
jgi:hypothetical protein